MSRIYYAWDNDGDMVFKDHSVFCNTPQNYLYRAGAAILDVYGEVIRQLWHENSNPAALRLQNALAAAVEDVSLEEFRDFSAAELANLRSRCGANKLFIRQTAPPLVLFLGKRPPTTIDSSGSDTPPDEWIGSPWMDDWDAEEGSWPRNWGCHVRGTDARSWYIFLSAAYVIWPHEWPQQYYNGLDGARLYTHLKLTLFNELVHHSRIAVYGRVPEKTIEGPCNEIGKEGSLAQILAFGSVVDMLIGEIPIPSRQLFADQSYAVGPKVTLFTTDIRAPLGTADFCLDNEIIGSFFLDNFRPIDLQELAKSPETWLADVPAFARTETGTPQYAGHLVEVQVPCCEPKPEPKEPSAHTGPAVIYSTESRPAFLPSLKVDPHGHVPFEGIDEYMPSPPSPVLLAPPPPLTGFIPNGGYTMPFFFFPIFPIYEPQALDRYMTFFAQSQRRHLSVKTQRLLEEGRQRRGESIAVNNPTFL